METRNQKKNEAIPKWYKVETLNDGKNENDL